MTLSRRTEKEKAVTCKQWSITWLWKNKMTSWNLQTNESNFKKNHPEWGCLREGAWTGYLLQSYCWLLKLSKESLPPATDGSRSKDSQQSTGLSSGSPVVKNDEGLYKPSGDQAYEGETHKDSWPELLRAHWIWTDS